MAYLIAMAVGLAGFYYVFLPQLAFDNMGLYLGIFILTLPAIFAMASKMEMDSGRVSKTLSNVGVFSTLIAGLALLAMVVLTASSMAMFRAESYKNLLGTETTKDFVGLLPPLDEHNVPLVSYDMAMRAAEKKLSEVTALGSQAHVGTLQKQRIGNELYWVGFLEHRGFFAWLNQKTTPGYVKVSATDSSDVELVTHVQGKPLKMRYLASGNFGDDAERHLRFDGYATTGLTDFSPEVDDAGNPFLVVTVFDRKVGASGKDARGVVVLDVQSGQSVYYATKDVPAWVDRVQPQEFVADQIADRVDYINGWLNPSNEGKLAIAGDLDLVYGKDGQAYFYAGLTSVGGDKGLIGFLLVNTRTKEVTRYALVGVTEQVAQASAEGVMPEKKYHATNALPFMVDGKTPAYVMALQDGTGIARAYGVVSLTDFQHVAVADTLPAALRSFKSKTSVDRTGLETSTDKANEKLMAVVLRVASEVRQGNSSYVLVLKGHTGKLYSADINRSEDLAVTREGDYVEITSTVSDQAVLPVLEFKNLTLHNTSDKATTPTASDKK